MEKQNVETRFLKWITASILTSLAFAVTLVVYTFFKINNEWVGFACWFLILILLLFPVGMAILLYLRIKKQNDSNRLKNEKTNKENEQKEHLTDLHHEYRLRALQNEIRLKELEIEKLKIEKGKG